MDTYAITFTAQELSFILKVLGDLPSKSGAYPLMMNIEAQLKEQAERRQVPE